MISSQAATNFMF